MGPTASLEFRSSSIRGVFERVSACRDELPGVPAIIVPLTCATPQRSVLLIDPARAGRAVGAVDGFDLEAPAAVSMG
jgi:hypothetical protein